MYKNSLVEIPKSIRVQKLLLGIFIFFMNVATYGQCAMCRAALEGEGNLKKAEAVNDGIVYLMMIPYILVGAIGVFIFRMYRKRKS